MRWTTVSIIDVFTQKKDVFYFPDLKNTFPHLNCTEIKEFEFFDKSPRGYKKYEEFCKIPMETVGQKIILENGRVLYRIVYVKLDFSGHNNTKPHLNIYLFSRDPLANKHKEHKLGECHNIPLGHAGTRPLQITIVTPGKALSRRMVLAPTNRDFKYLQKELKFHNKSKKDY